MFELHENVSRLFNSFMASLIAVCLVVVSCYIFMSVEHVLPYFPATVVPTATSTATPTATFADTEIFNPGL
jgi:CHASE2 domain-containing sensor protein